MHAYGDKAKLEGGCSFIRRIPIRERTSESLIESYLATSMAALILDLRDTLNASLISVTTCICFFSGLYPYKSFVLSDQEESNHCSSPHATEAGRSFSA